jgi:hypothetical protein
MSAATILFTDIVGFSKKPTADQKRLVDLLTREVIHELRPLLYPPTSTPSIIALPTGDGIALAFLHGADRKWDRVTIFGLLIRLQKWASVESEVSLRIGIHVGPIELITDINNNLNICGDTVNYSQRVMDAANPKQVLFSEAAMREYIGTHSKSVGLKPLSNEWNAEFKGPFEVFAKHDMQLVVYMMTLQPEQAWWSADEPKAKHIMLVTLTELPKEIVGSFADRVASAKDIAFIQLTGDRVLAKLQDGSLRCSDSLRRFWVFMPRPTSYANLSLPPKQASLQMLTECIAGWRDLFKSLKERFPNADLKLGLFDAPPFLGASFFNWDRSEGVIHISPYVWGIAARDCPGYDLRWLGKNPSPIYEVYVQGLQYLQSQTENVAFVK